MKIRFGELSNGSEFDYAGNRLVKTGEYNAVTAAERGKQYFVFSKGDKIEIKPVPSYVETKRVAFKIGDREIGETFIRKNELLKDRWSIPIPGYEKVSLAVERNGDEYDIVCNGVKVGHYRCYIIDWDTLHSLTFVLNQQMLDAL